jgi:hypothetical protein
MVAMKLFAAADIHGAQYRLNIVLRRIDELAPDLCVICGDITQFGPAEVATNFLDQIPVDTVAVPGNIDPPTVHQAINESKAENITMKREEKKGVPFVGLDVTQLGEPMGSAGQVKSFVETSIDETCVLVSHVPPYGLQDTVFLGRHAGSKELRSIIEQYTPRLVLCGHIHEDPGVTRFKNSVVVNCSIGKYTEGAFVEITDKKVDVKILE